MIVIENMNFSPPSHAVRSVHFSSDAKGIQVGIHNCDIRFSDMYSTWIICGAKLMPLAIG